MDTSSCVFCRIWSMATEPATDDKTVINWFGGLVLLIVLSFLWSTVVKQIE